MNTPTDKQLKQALAKMLPETNTIMCGDLRWKQGAQVVLDTELLHLCWLVEETLAAHEASQYVIWLYDLNNPIDKHYRAIGFQKYHATWQRRTVALARVLGVEIV